MATRRRPKLSLVLKCDAGPSCCNLNPSKENVVTLNPSLWEKLPENLLEQILAKLPFSALIRFCCVCKKWKNLLLSNEISTRCNSCKPVLVHSLAGPLTVYSPSRGGWEKLPVSYLPIDVSQLSLVASGSGLLCFSTDSFGEFLICNPLTKQYRRLQMPCGEGQGCVMPVPSPLHLNRDESGMNCMIRLGYLRVGMVFNTDTGFYKLVVASIYEGSGRTTLVYDSSNCSWKKAAMVPQGRFFRMKAIPCGGHLYCGITGVESGVGGESGGFAKLVRYDAEKETWSAILIPAHLGFPRKLVEHRDRLLLLARPNWQISETFDFFELQEAGSRMWLAAKYMPRRLMDSVYAAMSRPNNPILRSYIKCFGQGDIMYFVGICVKRAEVDPLMRGCSRSITGLRVWTHDFSSNSCLRLSDWEDWDLDNGPLSYHLLSPSLHAQV
ncbi:hypothetical protein Mapa_005000 [Marchantia paleacea]|nr:hypothetical protein Mapa_005000 [Marchantia paleacea]